MLCPRAALSCCERRLEDKHTIATQVQVGRADVYTVAQLCHLRKITIRCGRVPNLRGLDVALETRIAGAFAWQQLKLRVSTSAMKFLDTALPGSDNGRAARICNTRGGSSTRQDAPASLPVPADHALSPELALLRKQGRRRPSRPRLESHLACRSWCRFAPTIATLIGFPKSWCR
jgi:hypothetical protein